MASVEKDVIAVAWSAEGAGCALSPECLRSFRLSKTQHGDLESRQHLASAPWSVGGCKAREGGTPHLPSQR